MLPQVVDLVSRLLKYSHQVCGEGEISISIGLESINELSYEGEGEGGAWW